MENKRIIFENIDKSVAVLIPSKEALNFATIKQIAEKDVPKDLPYWIVEDSYIPTDRSYREAWEIDKEALGNPNGFGGATNTFDSQLLLKYQSNLGV